MERGVGFGPEFDPDKQTTHNHSKDIRVFHDHDSDHRATLRAKDAFGQSAFGLVRDKAIKTATSDIEIQKANSGLLTLFHFIGHRVIFPFTPAITIGGHATYEEYSFTHSNYKYHAYDSSAPEDIQIVAQFVAQTQREAEYLLGVMHFLRTLTKSYFGRPHDKQQFPPGTPPPVLLFNYMGKFQFNDVPVVIADYSYVLEPDIDYVEVHGRNTRVPSEVMISVTLKHFYNTKKLREFDLEKFRTGELITKGFI